MAILDSRAILNSMAYDPDTNRLQLCCFASLLQEVHTYKARLWLTA